MKSNAVPIVALAVSLVGFGAIVTVQNRTTQQQIADLRAQIARTSPVPTASSKPSADTELAEVTAYLTQIADRIDTQRLIVMEFSTIKREGDRRTSRTPSAMTPEEVSAADQLRFSTSQLQQQSGGEFLNTIRSNMETTQQQLRRDTTFLSSTPAPPAAEPFRQALSSYWAEYYSFNTLIEQQYDAMVQAAEHHDTTAREIVEKRLQKIQTQISYTKAERAQKELEALIQKYPQLPERLKHLKV